MPHARHLNKLALGPTAAIRSAVFLLSMSDVAPRRIRTGHRFASLRYNIQARTVGALTLPALSVAEIPTSYLTVGPFLPRSNDCSSAAPTRHR